MDNQITPKIWNYILQGGGFILGLFLMYNYNLFKNMTLPPRVGPDRILGFGEHQ